jgi:transposase
MGHYGIGALTAVTILAELGDCRRFSSSRLAVRYSGLDITVHQSDQRRAPGHLSRPGAAAAALGAVRGRPERAAQRFTGSRLLHPGRRPARRKPRPSGRRAQAAEAQLSHAA